MFEHRTPINLEYSLLIIGNSGESLRQGPIPANSPFFNMIKRFNNWYSQPEQEYVRMECRWFRRWLTRWPGWFLCFLYAIIVIFGTSITSAMFAGTSEGMVTLVAYASTLPMWLAPLLIKWGVFVFILQRRVLDPLRGDRLRDLLVTPVKGSDLWPALLFSPLLWCGCCELAWVAGLILTLAMIDLGGIGASMPPGFFNSLAMQPLVLLGTGLLTSVLHFITGAGILSLALRRGLPKGGIVRVMIWLIVGWIFFVWAIQIVFTLLIVLSGFMFSSNSVVSAVMFNLMMFSGLLAALVSGFLGLRLWRSNVRRLGSADMWEKLRLRSETEL